LIFREFLLNGERRKAASKETIPVPSNARLNAMTAEEQVAMPVMVDTHPCPRKRGAAKLCESCENYGTRQDENKKAAEMTQRAVMAQKTVNDPVPSDATLRALFLRPAPARLEMDWGSMPNSRMGGIMPGRMVL
jgi:hypothetical protein